MVFDFPNPESRIPNPDSRFPIPESRFPIPDSRFPQKSIAAEAAPTENHLWSPAVKSVSYIQYGQRCMPNCA
jgi:hypothetical protein